MIDTRQAARRSLHFTSLPQIVDDAETVLDGPHHTTGNWTAGQIIDHVAGLIDLSNGETESFEVPLPVKLFGRGLKLIGAHRKPFKPGLKPPPSVWQKLAPAAEISEADGLARLKHAVGVASRSPMTTPSPLFGKLSHEDWVILHCRHAELHFSFMRPDDEIAPTQAAD